MNREHAKAMAPLIKAFGDGEDVQVDHATRGWSTFDDLSFTGSPKLYRIKPKPREWWMADVTDEYRKVLESGQKDLTAPYLYIKVREVL